MKICGCGGAAFAAACAAGVMLAVHIPLSVLAEESVVSWEEIPETEADETEDSDAGQTQEIQEQQEQETQETDDVPEESSQEDTGYAVRIETEKGYLLEALDQLEDWGLSPIAIWSGITNDDSIMNMLAEVSGSVTESVSDAVSGLQEGIASETSGLGEEFTGELEEQIGEAVEEQTQKVKQGLIEKIREQINTFLDSW